MARVVAKVEVVAAAHPEAATLLPGRDPVTAPTDERVEVRASTYGDADVVALVAEVQAHYVEIYGGEDETPMTPEDFEAPEGTFVIAEVAGEPVACGAFRRHEGADGAVAEIKRMYVRPAHRHRGVARAVLADLEARARAPATRGSFSRRGSGSRPRSRSTRRGLHRDRAVRLLPLQPAEPLLRQRPHVTSRG